MKLPKSVADYETPFNMAFAEAIVRDCAQVCLTEGIGNKYQGDVYYDAIMRRYGLEPGK